METSRASLHSCKHTQSAHCRTQVRYFKFFTSLYFGCSDKYCFLYLGPEYNPAVFCTRELRDMTDAATRACSDPELTDITTAAAPHVREVIGEDLPQVALGHTCISFLYSCRILCYLPNISFAVTGVTGDGGHMC